MDKLDKLDGIEKQISNFQTSLQDINDKIADFSGKLQVLESIPALVQRVDAAVEDIEKLKSDYNSRRQTVDSHLCSSVSAEGATDTSDRLHHLKQINATLSSRLSELADTQQRLSSDIVLGRFKHKIGVNSSWSYICYTENHSSRLRVQRHYLHPSFAREGPAKGAIDAIY